MSLRRAPAAAATTAGERRLRAVLEAGLAHAAIGHPCGPANKREPLQWQPPSELRLFHQTLRKLELTSRSFKNDAVELRREAIAVWDAYVDLRERKGEGWFEKELGANPREHPWGQWLLDIKKRAAADPERFGYVMAYLDILMNKIERTEVGLLDRFRT